MGIGSADKTHFMLQNLDQYQVLNEEVLKLSSSERMPVMRELAKKDLFFLLTTICGRKDLWHSWLLARCIEVQNNPDGYLDLWARDHRKSTIITFGKTIQDILNDPELTFGIFSHSAKIATPFLLQIRAELTDNELLKELFPDVLYANPKKEAEFWNSERLVVRRQSLSNKEATVEAHGIVENQPTSKHFAVCVYDDMVTQEGVATPEMIKKTLAAWEMSLNLGTKGGKRRYIGTFYHFADCYHTMIERKAAIPRIHAATIDGTPTGKPVFLSQAEWDNKINDHGGVNSYILSCQLLLNPVSGKNRAFHFDDLRFFEAHEQKRIEMSKSMNVYLWCDPARAKTGAVGNKKGSDYTAIAVIGLNHDQNYYLLDIVRARLNLMERCETLFAMIKKWHPKVVGYEQNGAQADMDYIKAEQTRLNYRFAINYIQNNLNKKDKIISTLQPIYGKNKFWLPQEILKPNEEGVLENLVEIFIESEYKVYPFAPFDDLLDAKASCLKFLNPLFPLENRTAQLRVISDKNINIPESMKEVTIINNFARTKTF